MIRELTLAAILAVLAAVFVEYFRADSGKGKEFKLIIEYRAIEQVHFSPIPRSPTATASLSRFDFMADGPLPDIKTGLCGTRRRTPSQSGQQTNGLGTRTSSLKE